MAEVTSASAATRCQTCLLPAPAAATRAFSPSGRCGAQQASGRRRARYAVSGVVSAHAQLATHAHGVTNHNQYPLVTVKRAYSRSREVQHRSCWPPQRQMAEVGRSAAHHRGNRLRRCRPCRSGSAPSEGAARLAFDRQEVETAPPGVIARTVTTHGTAWWRSPPGARKQIFCRTGKRTIAAVRCRMRSRHGIVQALIKGVNAESAR